MGRPVVLVSACTQQIDSFSYHAAQAKYVDAVVNGADCVPLIMPALGEQSDLDVLLDAADGILLTGSPSNVDPHFFGEEVLDRTLPLDPARDATTLPLVRFALQLGVPLLGICRGAQELNVAVGGSLHQAVHTVAGMMDHRDRDDDPLEKQYAPAHQILLEPHGRLRTMLGGLDAISVNSLHGQGIADLAPYFVVEARAEDGLIEAFSGAAQHGFSLAVQWHPEWRLSENPVSQRVFSAFGNACRDYKRRRMR